MKQNKLVLLAAALTVTAFLSSCSKKEESKPVAQKETTVEQKKPAKAVEAKKQKAAPEKAIKVTQKGSKISFSVEQPKSSGQPIKIVFDKSLPFKGDEHYWVTIVPKGALPAEYGPWKDVVKGDKSASLECPRKPGEYEIRLHSGAPYKTFNLVSKMVISVK